MLSSRTEAAEIAAGTACKGLRRRGSKVYITDRSGQIGGIRYQYTGPVWPETGRNRSKSNLNLKFSVQMVRTGIPAGLTGNRSV